MIKTVRVIFTFTAICLFPVNYMSVATAQQHEVVFDPAEIYRKNAEAGMAMENLKAMRLENKRRQTQQENLERIKSSYSKNDPRIFPELYNHFMSSGEMNKAQGVHQMADMRFMEMARFSPDKAADFYNLALSPITGITVTSKDVSRMANSR